MIVGKKNKDYWEDSRWANSHLDEISREYPGQWVAIANRTVVAAGKQLDAVIAEAGKNRPHGLSFVLCRRPVTCLLRFAWNTSSSAITSETKRSSK